MHKQIMHKQMQQQNQKQAACPICGKPSEPRYRPFCSARCADIDLGRWFAGVYRLPASDSAEAESKETPEAEEAG